MKYAKAEGGISARALRARRAHEHRVANLDISVYTDMQAEIQAGVERSRQARSAHQMEWDPGHVYVIRFASGVVKVGKTGDPINRLRSHAKWAAVFGDKVEETWVSQRHPNQSKTERSLIAYCRAEGTPVSTEYFTGLSFNAVRDLAQIMTDYIAERCVLADQGEVDEEIEQVLQEAHRRAFGGEPS